MFASPREEGSVSKRESRKAWTWFREPFFSAMKCLQMQEVFCKAVRQAAVLRFLTRLFKSDLCFTRCAACER